MKSLSVLEPPAAVVTTTGPPLVPSGTVITIFVPLQETTWAGCPPIVTVDDPFEEPKLLPDMVICVPGGPEEGETEETTGAGLLVLNGTSAP